jgi:type IV secretion system protein VirB9
MIFHRFVLNIALAGASLALAAPAAHAEDARLVTRTYDPNEVVHIDGRPGVQAMIAFGDGEQIENVAVGDAEKWQITPNKRADLLFIKPLQANARTNMTVVTNRHTYFFDLASSTKAKPVYRLRFTYKDQKRPTGAAQPALASAERPSTAAASLDPASLDFAWARKGSDKILPSAVYDDGESTYLVWPAGMAVPAILTENEKGEEGPVNYAVRGNVTVVNGVPPKLVLRLGKAHATLTRRSNGRHRRESEVREAAGRAAAAPVAAAAAAPAVSARPD